MVVRLRVLLLASLSFPFLITPAAQAASNAATDAVARAIAATDPAVDCGDQALIDYCNSQVVVHFAADAVETAITDHTWANCCYCFQQGEGPPEWAQLCVGSSGNNSSSSSSDSSDPGSSASSDASSSVVSSDASSSSDPTSSISNSSITTSSVPPSSSVNSSSSSANSSLSSIASSVPSSSSSSSSSSTSGDQSSSGNSTSGTSSSGTSSSSSGTSSSGGSSSGSSSSGGNCPPGSPDPECLNPGLDPEACANANGFLDQVNIASVLNLRPTPLGVIVEYRDASGILRGSVQTEIAANLKRDFIVNDLGLQPSTYGTVCVRTNAQTAGQWLGGVTFYKRNQRANQTGYDFALYEPFMNPVVGAYTMPLNTFHLGTDARSTVANWVRITDAVSGDARGLRGTILYYNDQGTVVGQDLVNLSDGGRFDYPAHERIGGPENHDAVGMARFIPEPHSDGTAARYYVTSGRYFYDCVGAGCPNFLTAFTMPYRPPTSNELAGDVSTKDGISIIELNNVGQTDVQAQVGVHGASGAFAGTMTMPVPPLGTRHIIVNRVGDQGFLADNTVGAATVNSAPGYLSSLTLFYKLDKDSGRLLYGTAAPFAGSPGVAQISEFNSFIEHTNRSWLFNSSTQPLSASIDILNFTGQLIAQQQFNLPASGSQDFTLPVPADTYGTLIINSSQSGLVFRNYTSRRDEYVMTYIGK